MRNRTLLIPALLAAWGCHASQPGAPLTTSTQRAPWTSPYAQGERIQTPHYAIYSTTKTSSLQQYFPGFMEASHQNYLAITGLDDEPSGKRLPMYLLGSREEWAALTQKVTGPQAEQYLSIEAGGYCFQGVCVLFDIAPMATFSVGAHEGMHQFLSRRMKQNLPLWLEEGLCVTAEGHEIQGANVKFTPEKNILRYTDLRAAIVGSQWIPLAKLLPLDAGDVVSSPDPRGGVGYYGQLWALVRYIRSQPQYKSGLRRMLLDAQDGKLQEALGLSDDEFRALQSRPKLYNQTLSEKLFRHYISEDLEGFDKDYFRYAKNSVDLR